VNVTGSETTQDGSASTSNAGDHIMISRAHYMLDDLLYSADQKILFTGLLSWWITDFAWAKVVTVH
jgi:hypothetical protein